MIRWKINCYLSSSGRDVIDDWFRDQGPKVQAEFLARLHYLKQQPITGWTRPHFARLTGDCAGLGEIRFKADRVQHRLLGFFGPAQAEFSIVICAQEKDGKFEPRDACKTGLHRKGDILRDGAHAHECDF